MNEVILTIIKNSIVLFAGYIFDMEIGLTMATIYDPQTRTQVSVSGQLYQNLFMLIFIATGMHWYQMFLIHIGNK